MALVPWGHVAPGEGTVAIPWPKQPSMHPALDRGVSTKHTMPDAGRDYASSYRSYALCLGFRKCEGLASRLKSTQFACIGQLHISGSLDTRRVPESANL